MFPSFYEFYCPVKIVCGKKALPNLPYELEQLGAHRPLIVTDAGVAGAGLLDRVTAVFAGSRCEVGAVYDQTPADSSHRVVNELAALYRREGCDSLLAVGGGSPIDTAKGVNILVSEDSDDLILQNNVFGLINTQVNLPLQYHSGRFDLEFGYNLNFPSELEGESGLENTGFFNAGIGYLIDL